MTQFEPAKDLVLEAANYLRTIHPNLSISVGVAASLYHTPKSSPDVARWCVTVGHHDTVFGATFAECLANMDAQYSPAAKRAKISELRRQADQLEAELSP